MKAKPFTDVSFPTEYPPNEVAEHEVLMAFRNDGDAVFFREWWGDKGAAAFGEWLRRRPTAEQ